MSAAAWFYGQSFHAPAPTADSPRPAIERETVDRWDEAASRWRHYRCVRNADTGLFETECEVDANGIALKVAS